MAYKNMKKNKQLAKQFSIAYKRKNVEKLTESEQDQLYYKLFRRKFRSNS